MHSCAPNTVFFLLLCETMHFSLSFVWYQNIYGLYTVTLSHYYGCLVWININHHIMMLCVRASTESKRSHTFTGTDETFDYICLHNTCAMKNDGPFANRLSCRSILSHKLIHFGLILKSHKITKCELISLSCNQIQNQYLEWICLLDASKISLWHP